MSGPPARRMAIAVLALAGTFMSLYLYLHSLGFYGELVCGTSGGCSLVQASRYARFLGFSVAGWGLLWYLGVFSLALAAVQPRFAGERWPSMGLLLMATAGLAFTIYLTWLELFVIHAICRWCVGSAVLTVTIFLLALPWGGRSSDAATI